MEAQSFDPDAIRLGQIADLRRQATAIVIADREAVANAHQVREANGERFGDAMFPQAFDPDAFERMEDHLRDLERALGEIEEAFNEAQEAMDGGDVMEMTGIIHNAWQEAQTAFAAIPPAHLQTLDAIDEFMELEEDRVQVAVTSRNEKAMGGLVLAESTPEQAAAHAAAHAELLDAHTAKLLAEAVGQPHEKPNLSASEEEEPKSKSVRSSIKGDDSNTKANANANANDNDLGGAGDVRSSVRTSLGPRPPGPAASGTGTGTGKKVS